MSLDTEARASFDQWFKWVTLSPTPASNLKTYQFTFPSDFWTFFIADVLQKAERKWEEKRQNLDHYNGKEFEKLLEEAQANIMKSIPNLEMPPASGPQPKGDAAVDKLELSGKVLSELCGATHMGTGWPMGSISHFLKILYNIISQLCLSKKLFLIYKF